MIFNSFIFWAFFATVLVVYWRLPHRQQNLFLILASYVFYGYWDWRYLFLLWTSTLVDYFVGRGLDRVTDPRRRKWLITVSVSANLGFLSFFKYCGFFVTQFADMLRSLGRAESDSVLAEQGSVDVTCEFCNRRYVFDEADVAEVFADEPPVDDGPTRH